MNQRQIERHIAAMRANPATFRRHLIIDADGGPQWLERRIEPWQRADFEALDNGWRRVAGLPPDTAKPTFMRGYLERPRGHSKSSDIAISLSWALFASDRMLSGLAVAADEDQARLLIKAAGLLLSLNPWLADFLEVQRDRIVNKKTDSTLSIISSDVSSSYGRTDHFICCDEVTHWKNPDLWASILSTAGKKDALLMLIANAGFCPSWQWDLREAIRSDPKWYFHRLNGPQASWITTDRLDEQRRLIISPTAYRRLWLNEWCSGTGDALREDDISAALKLSHPPDSLEPGWIAATGVDIGTRRDFSAAVTVAKHVGYVERIEKPPRPVSPTVAAMIDMGYLDGPDLTDYETHMYPSSGKLKLLRVDVWRPPLGGVVDFSDIEATLRAINSQFRPACVGIESPQAESTVQRLQKDGIPAEIIPPTSINVRGMATALLSAFGERLLEIFEHPQLLFDLRNLQVVERGNSMKLDSPRVAGQGHGDVGKALQLALLLFQQNSHAWQTAEDANRPLVCWP